MTGTPQATLLTTAMQAAVPLWIMTLEGEPDVEQRWKLIHRWCAEGQRALLETGEALLYRSEKRGESARAFNAAAKAIAALAFLPGGVTVFGTHWEAAIDPRREPRLADTHA